jgi:hypothetical protein
MKSTLHTVHAEFPCYQVTAITRERESEREITGHIMLK